ncbi:MAG TPA: GtrA family protein [Polyangiaceae bacterium]|jgi:putative flippase GtrA|nr:GtrA family protein [Polyangiaceae bacterium]
MIDRPWKGIYTFLRSVLVGAAATIADLVVLALAVGFFGVSARAANVPALLAGVVIQFVGNRHWAFEAAHGRLRRQLVYFTLVEVGALLLNAIAYDLVARQTTLDAVGAVVVRLIVSAVVFLGFSFPLWRRVFYVPAPA